VLGRWVIRLAMTFVGIAVGLLVSAALLDDFDVSAEGLLVATALFWILHIVVQFLALRILIRQPSIAMAGLLALGSTIVALVIVNLLLDGITIEGVGTYVLATLIIWITTAASDVVGGMLIRERRNDRLE
jgi:hypothetical protein